MTLRELILEKLAELGEGMLDAFFPATYPQARLWRNLLGNRRSYKLTRPTFSSILSQLRRDGFVEHASARQKGAWRITQKGLAYLAARKTTPRPTPDGVMRVVSFDIPEEQRKKRRWIREELIDLGYQPLQKSVWVGFTPLPEDFFEDLDLMALRNHIHLFSVKKSGTIHKS